jgi:Kdo2-lipid IVA lauroyltransferase/acyltransferase
MTSFDMASLFFRFLLRLPFGVRRAIARALYLLRVLADVNRRALVQANLAVAFDTFSEAELCSLEAAHCRASAEAWFDNVVAFAGGPAVVRSMVRLEGAELLQRSGQPTIVASAHFVDVYLALLRVAMESPGAIIYREPTEPSLKRRLLRQIERFSAVQMIASKACIRPALKALKAGLPLVVLADQPDDLRGAVARPFLRGGIAWSPAISFLVSRTGAQVLWLDVKREEDGGYLVTLSPLAARSCTTESDIFAGLAQRLTAAATARPEHFRWDRGQLLSRRRPSDQSAAKAVQIPAAQSSLAESINRA